LKKLALISVFDKTDISELAKALHQNKYDIIATGNSASKIREAGIDVKEISDITNFPEIFAGRVKSLHPKIVGGILFRRDNEKDREEVIENGIVPIDVVCVNLYPFLEVTKNPNMFQFSLHHHNTINT
jgi:phosphoribosylaminoimidazolecarboxamide formyltransferase/IMP cyclohydrolase